MLNPGDNNNIMEISLIIQRFVPGRGTRIDKSLVEYFPYFHLHAYFNSILTNV